MKSYKSKWFQRWQKKTNLLDKTLHQAIKDLEEEKSSVKLASNLYKVRIADEGRGKRGSYRTIIVYKAGVRCVFIAAFAKNESDNISKTQLADYKEYAKTLIRFSEEEFKGLVSMGSFITLEGENNE